MGGFGGGETIRDVIRAWSGISQISCKGFNAMADSI